MTKQVPRQNLEDFLIDDTFHRFCEGNDEKCVRYWEDYMADHPDQAELILRAKRLYFVLVGNRPPIHVGLEQIKRTVQYTSPHDTRKFGNLMLWFKVAAVVFLLGAGAFWFILYKENKQFSFPQEQKYVYSTQKGEKKSLALIDGTRVVLNAGSRIILAPDFNQEQRIVYLIGEAYFEVSKDKSKPFIVHTEDFDVKVLGTTFNIKAYPEENFSEALLVEGLIEMRSNQAKSNSILVKPHQKVTIYRSDKEALVDRLDKKRPTTGIINTEIAIQNLADGIGQDEISDLAWKSDRLELVDQEFLSLKSVLERWYDVDINLKGDSLKHYRFTATFYKEDIKQVLDALKKVKPFNYEIYGKKITIEEK